MMSFDSTRAIVVGNRADVRAYHFFGSDCGFNDMTGFHFFRKLQSEFLCISRDNFTTMFGLCISLLYLFVLFTYSIFPEILFSDTGLFVFFVLLFTASGFTIFAVYYDLTFLTYITIAVKSAFTSMKTSERFGVTAFATSPHD